MITHPVSIDGYSQANVGCRRSVIPTRLARPYRNRLSAACRRAESFTLTTSAPLRSAQRRRSPTTPRLPRSSRAARGDHRRRRRRGHSVGPVNTAVRTYHLPGTIRGRGHPEFDRDQQPDRRHRSQRDRRDDDSGRSADAPPLLITSVPNTSQPSTATMPRSA